MIPAPPERRRNLDLRRSTVPPLPTRSQLLDRYAQGSEHGNRTSIDIAATPSVAWAALHEVGLKDCRTTRALSALRTMPGRLTRRGAFSSNTSVAIATDLPLLESMSRDRFITLDDLPNEEVILGVIGQFWKPGGGTDAPVTEAAEFLAFDTPGYVKVAVNFRVDATPRGCTLTTETRCVATDAGAARRFSIYWALIGWGSKVIRWDILAAARRRAEATRSDWRQSSHDGPSRVLKALFKVPVLLYRGRLGFLFFRRLIVVVHRGRTSGNRYVSGLEVLERSDDELFVFSAWGTGSDWYRNIAANGVEALWDGTKRIDAWSRVVSADEAVGILSNYEKAHQRLARLFLPRMYPGYDFTDESRRMLAATGVIVAFGWEVGVNDGRIGSYRWRDIWPRHTSRSLPPGQRPATVMPRFSARPTVAPPRVTEPSQLEITGDVTTPLQLDLDHLHRISRTEMVEDFHCVTTWTVPELRWAGWRFADVWQQLIEPDAEPEPDATHIRVRGADGYWAVLDLEDALRPEVMLADTLEGRPLNAFHGAPLRLVSPQQYGYKSVKHVTAITIHNRAPRRYGGAIEHPRARVAFEERHTHIAGGLLRWPYRALIIPTAAIAQRSARKQS